MVRFRRSWDRLELPVTGRIAVIDSGEPAIGLSAMQLNALGVHSAIVKVRYKGRTCEAKVWNACCMNSTKGDDEIRVADVLAKILGCKKGDDIEFIEIVAHTLPVRIGPID